MKHTVGGISRGRNTVSDCCMKKAITPMNPRTNPMALASGRAPFSSFWFCNIIPTCIEGVYMAVYFFPSPKAEKTVTETKEEVSFADVQKNTSSKKCGRIGCQPPFLKENVTSTGKDVSCRCPRRYVKRDRRVGCQTSVVKSRSLGGVHVPTSQGDVENLRDGFGVVLDGMNGACGVFACCDFTVFGRSDDLQLPRINHVFLMSERCHHSFPVALMNFGNEMLIDLGSLNAPSQGVSHDLMTKANAVQGHIGPLN